jgi:glycosyltransferase involved in cell wall biosynthesis
MTFSVLINNYNYGRFIGAAIESVLAQTHGDFELIIVDDGSTDDSRAVIERCSDRRIRTVFQANQGQGAAFQAGFAAASGEAIALLDSDDEWHPEKLAVCAAALSRDPGISLLQHAWDQIDGSGKTLRTIRPQPEGAYDPIPDYGRLRFDLPFGPTSCVVGPSRFFHDLRFDPAEWRLAADTPVVAGLSVLGRCHFLPDSLTRYRVHGANGFDGRQTFASLLELRKRFYRSVDDHLARTTGPHRRHRFENSSVYQASIVTSHPRFTGTGLIARLRYRLALLTGR